MAIPFLVIHYSSKEVWGSFVSILLFTLFALQIINWGNKEYLLREFSINPSRINQNFSENMVTRLPLVILFSLIAPFIFPTINIFFVFLWILGRYFSYSVEPLLFFEKKFNLFLIIEMITFLLFCTTLFFFKEDINSTKLLIVYSLYQFIKGVISLLFFRSFIRFKNLQFNYIFYKKALPFFMLSAFGFLISKSDVFFVQYFCDKSTTANYQILNSLFVFIITISVFIYSPFTKNIYRNNTIVTEKYQKTLSLLGLVIIPISLFFCYFIILYYLKLKLSFWFYMLAFIYIYPSYLYGIQIVNKFKTNKEQLVILYLFYSAITNVFFSSFFLYLGYGILGALSGGCLSQIVALYLFCVKKDTKTL
jgi:uncharacterized membrane protein YidH (DUF202 family)